VTADRVPLVSILIPCYNAEKWVGEAIQSALDQTYRNIEVIVVDDGSSDGSLEVIKSFGDRIRWETGPNRGANAARNRLLELSRGEWLQYLDADDILLPAKVQRQIDAVQQGSADLVVSPGLNEHGCITQWGPGEDPWERLISARLGNTIANLWRSAAVRQCGGWKKDQPCAQEAELMVRMLKAGCQVHYVAEALAVARGVNPKSVWRSNRYRRSVYRSRYVLDAIRFLAQGGMLTPARRKAGGMALYKCAQDLWGIGHPYWKEVLMDARSVDNDLARSLRSVWFRHGVLYSLFGFRVTQLISRLNLWLRRRYSSPSGQETQGATAAGVPSAGE